MPNRGSVLIIVLWICLGLVALTLYFSGNMSSELRAAGNRVGETEARQAVASGIRYAQYVLTQYGTGGIVPHKDDYQAEALPVGGATFWFLGRDPDRSANASEPYFGLVDEASKLNLNRATSPVLQGLPGITPDIADAIIAWRNANSESAASGSADNLYTRLEPARLNKGAPFETTDELRLVYGMTLDLLLGEDPNRNGILDANEDDGDASPPYDDSDGQMLAGVLEHVTVYSRLPTTRADGSRRINISNLSNQAAQQELRTLLTSKGIEAQRVQAIMGAATQGGELATVADFMVRSRMSVEEFDLIHTDLTDGANQRGRVNVNTASETVLACIFGTENASAMVAYRTANRDSLKSMAWLTAAGVPQNAITRVGQSITDQSYQFSADVVAIGAHGRGYCRERVVFDTSSGTPRIIYRQDLGAAGWALGTRTRQNIRAAKDTSS